MPCLYAHTLFGFSVRDRLPQPLAALLARNEAAFLAGLPGPDIYFFDRFPPPLLHPHEKRTGNALHNAPADTVFAQLLSLAAGDEALLAYTLGFLCHYALDSAIHPFVDARYRGLDHTRFEMRLELAFCARRGSRLSGIPPHRLYAPPVREPYLLDRLDALKWIQWIMDTIGEDVSLMLHGISMGGATVLMTSGLKLPGSVKGIVSDCGFTSPKYVFTHVLHSMYHLPAFPMIQIADLVNRKKAGYGLDECNAAREVQKATVPILLIHGSNDTFVPCSMCEEIYENCRSPKKKLIVTGAAHAESYYKDMKAYEAALDNFIGGVIK